MPQRFEKEAQNLSSLTGWDIADIRDKMKNKGQKFDPEDVPTPTPWWEDIWND